jgi:hypothetical protein
MIIQHDVEINPKISSENRGALGHLVRKSVWQCIESRAGCGGDPLIGEYAASMALQIWQIYAAGFQCI